MTIGQPSIQIDPASPVPLYLQIARQIRRLVAIGALRAGDRLPPVRELAATVRVNRNTAARAIQRLESDGVVRTRVGQGTFVEDGPARVDRERGERAVDRLLDELLVEAQTWSIPLEDLRERLDRRIERFSERGVGMPETDKETQE
jgi:GntR family transcriptional regulator